MTVYLVMIGLFALTTLIFVYPKWGSFLVWPILFTYPHFWWAQRQFLPLNIGMDDLFCLGLFLVVVFRRNLMEGRRVRFGFAFWIVTSFVLIAALSNLVSALDAASSLDRTQYFKAIMKLGVYWALFYAILHCIDNKRDLRLQLTMFSLAAAAGAVIIILQRFFPGQMYHWAAPVVVRAQGIELG